MLKKSLPIHSFLAFVVLLIFSTNAFPQEHLDSSNSHRYSTRCRVSMETGRSSRAIEPPEWEGLTELDCHTHKNGNKLGFAYMGQYFYATGLVNEGRFGIGPSFRSLEDKIIVSGFAGLTTRGQAYLGSSLRLLLIGKKETEYFPEITFGNGREKTFHQRLSQQLVGKWLYFHGDSLKIGHHNLGRIGAEIRLRPKKESDFEIFINPDMVIPEKTFGLIVGTRFTFGSKH